MYDTTNLIPAVGYCRFSSSMQREESIEAQKRAISIFADHSGYRIIGFYSDKAKSGKTTDREEFQRMIQDSTNGTFKAVIVHKLDRFSRDVVDTLTIDKQLKANGVSLVSVSETLDNSPQGELVKTIISGVNRYNVTNLASEVTKGHIENVYKGLSTGGNGPLGYDIVNKKYVINEKGAEAVRLIFKHYAEGMGYNQIINKLNRLGYKTKKNEPFGKNSISSILHNERYTGVHYYGKTQGANPVTGKRNMHNLKPDDEVIKVPGVIPQIIELSLYNQVQDRLMYNKRMSGSNNAKHEYQLSGLVYCMECGCAIEWVRKPI